MENTLLFDLMPLLLQLPLLSSLLLLMLVGIGLIFIQKNVDKNGKRVARIALLTSLSSLVVSLFIVMMFDKSNADFQFVEQHNWIPTLNIYYQVGVDGISLLFLPLSSLMFVAIILASWNRIHNMPKLYYSLLLLLLGAILGIFIATDTILFLFFWELTLIPVYFLVALWGKGVNRRYAATKYVLLMMVGGIPVLFGLVLLALGVGSTSSELIFDYQTLLDNPLPANQQTLVFLLLLVGFAFKTPLFPFHTWLPVLTMEGPVAIGVVMTGLKLGVYGLIRFAIPLAPEAIADFHWLMAGLGVTGIIYGALLAMQQTNLRSMLAYSSISHIGLVVLSLSSVDIQGIQGAIFQLLNFTLISTGLFLIVGFLYARTETSEVISLGGVSTTMPLLASFFFLFGLASMGVPGTSGFPAEFMMLISSLKVHLGAGLAALFGMILGAVYFLTLFRRGFLGKVTSPVIAESKDLLKREVVIIVVLLLMVVAVGLYPRIVLDVIEPATIRWLENTPSSLRPLTLH